MKIKGLQKLTYQSAVKKMNANGTPMSESRLRAIITRTKYGTTGGDGIPVWKDGEKQAFKTACLEILEENKQAVLRY